jgi:4,5-dihydroxyphthalate decarboxylase
MAIWVRGVLAEEYDVPRSSVNWLAVTSSSQRTKIAPTVLEIPRDFVPKIIQAWEELDGYPHNLDWNECFLLSLLENRQLDAVVSFHPKIASPRIRPLLTTEDKLWSYHQKTRIYPINHIFVLRKELLPQFPETVAVLEAGFHEARRDWTKYLFEAERQGAEKEMAKLGWDPFAYHLTDVERLTLERFIAYLDEENLISERLSCNELFPG